MEEVTALLALLLAGDDGPENERTPGHL